MAQASRDQNYVTTLLAVSSVDGVTPVTLYANPTTHRLLVDLAGGGSGTVQTVSVASANGFAGTSDGDPTNPELTLSTTITGILKGNGTAISAVTVGSGLSFDGTTLSATAGGGNVSNTGTPVNNQIAVWTNATTIEGDADLTFDTSTNTLSTGIVNSTTLTASEIVITDGSKNLVSAAVATYPSLTELTYVKGVTSAIQTQLNAKQATITFGTGVETALGVNVGTAGSIVVNGGALGTPSSGTVTNLTGTASININGTVGATTPTTATFTTATINTGLVPDANDGAYLGTTAAQFSDLFLASGGVINWDNGTITLTQGSNELTVAGSGAILVAPTIVANTAFLPDANDGATLGNTSTQFSDLFLAEGGVINWDNGDATLTQASNDLTLAGASLTARIKPRVGTTTSSATPTINTDDVDAYHLTAQTADITSFTTNLSGTPTNFQQLRISVTGTAARAITWGSSFANGPVALPTTTVTTTRLDVLFEYDTVSSKWRCMASGSTV